MLLKSIKYTQFPNTPQEWGLEKFSLGKTNLLVGKNATGKTRTLNVITGLGGLVAGEKKLEYASGHYEVTFSENDSVIEYFLDYENAKISKEVLIKNGVTLLNRREEGKGTIFYEREKQSLEFQAPPNELACVARRDSVQHSFFESLFNWGNSIRYYKFGTSLGKDWLAVFGKDDKSVAPNPKETDKVVMLFREGEEKFGRDFVDAVLNDMKSIGYEFENITVAPIKGLQAQNILVSQELVGLHVKEKGLLAPVHQIEISQGMFRALSLIIQINLSAFRKAPCNVVIDDIGEGLDFERSSALIKLLVKKNEQISNQLIMSTNDRFVMNAVPLKYWVVIIRQENHCKMLNYENSRKLFDDFEFTGLNNFDFFASEYHLKNNE